ncbi:hypothetical protein HPB50_017115 [Hyalomma asiaticum]|uniref:Uncharacterized protein n=1 Tax=Hyalomma asiaticum TaxID=266040 RepID=A0ACB7RXD1_HYAAI|nr:hypothetical protein HPB50_017115 [Hyalomma asiaticum]
MMRPAVAAIVLAAGLFLVLACFLLMQASNPPSHKTPLCVTDDCLTHANLLMQAADTNIDACEDFYAHVCSRWLSHNERKHMKVLGRSVLEDMVISYLSRMGETLYRSSAVLRVAEKPLAMLKSCMSNSSTHGPTIAQFRDFMRAYLRLPWPRSPPRDVDALGVLITLAYVLQAPFWFAVRPSMSRRGAVEGRWSIVLTPAPLIRQYYLQYRTVRSSGLSAYVKYWMDFYGAFDSDGSAASEERAIQAEQLEERILKALSRAFEALPKHFVVIPIGQLHTYTPTVNSSKWLYYLQAYTNVVPALNERDVVLITDRVFFVTVGDLFGNYTNAQIVDFLVGSLSRGYDRLVSTAVRLVNNSTWLDSESKALVAEKLASAKLRLWPPAAYLDGEYLAKTYDNFPDDEAAFGNYWIRSIIGMTFLNRTPEYDEVLDMPVNYALPYFDYDYIENAVGVAMGAVNFPLFYRRGTKAMFYGGFGFSAAFQLAKALDKEGIQWDSRGRRAPSKPDDIQDNIVFSPLAVSSALTMVLAGTSGPTSRQLSAALNGADARTVHEQFSLDSSTVLALVSALYFKGRWDTPFDPSRTVPGDFHESRTRVVRTRMMSGDAPARLNRYCDGLVGHALDVAYKGSGGRFSMTLMVPDQLDGLCTLVESLTPERLDNILRGFDPQQDVQLELPRFKLEDTTDLRVVLQAMGVKDLFDPNLAEFSGFSARGDALKQDSGTQTKGLALSVAMHKAFIEVNEEGVETEAPKDTRQTRGSFLTDPSRFRVDRPFYFLIRCHSPEVILFAGTVRRVQPL